MTLPTTRDWIFSIKTFAAAMAALYIGFLMSVPRPYWAMATVYICSNPLSGATRSKSAYRLLGTLIGAVMAVILVPNLVDAPELLVSALAAWTALCLYVSLLDRTPRSYVFMLGGYTAALIGFPAVSDAGSIFDLAIARVEEISLGIICASLASNLMLPRSVGAVVAARINRWLGDGARFTLDVLAGRRDDRSTQTDLIRLAGDTAEIDILSTHLDYDIASSRDTRAFLRALRLRLLMLLPVLSSIADRLSALRRTGTALPMSLGEIVTRLRAWIRPEAPSLSTEDQAREASEADAMRRAIEAAQPKLHAGSDWNDLLLANLLIRLRELVDLASDCRNLRRAVVLGSRAAPPLHINPEASVSPTHHRDAMLPLLSALGVAVAIWVCSTLWIATGWPDGSSAPMMAAVACSFFAAKDDPAPAIVEFATWSAVAIVMIGIYLFAILPFVHDFEMLVLALAPAFIVIGMMISMPATMSKGMALGINGATLLALQGTYNADFPSFANSSIAFLVGLSLAAVLTRLTRSVGAEWAVRRLMRAGTVTLADAARGRGAVDRAQVAGLMIDRLGLLAPRLAALPPGHDLASRDILAQPRIGLNIVDLRRARHGLDEKAQARVNEVLDGLGRYFATSSPTRTGDLLDRIDVALAAVLAAGSSGHQRDAILGLVGIRRGLCPDAPPYGPAQPPGPALESIAA